MKPRWRNPGRDRLSHCPQSHYNLTEGLKLRPVGGGSLAPHPYLLWSTKSVWSKIFKWRTRFPPLPQRYGSRFETSVIPENAGNHWCFSVAGPHSPLKTPYVCLEAPRMEAASETSQASAEPCLQEVWTCKEEANWKSLVSEETSNKSPWNNWGNLYIGMENSQ